MSPPPDGRVLALVGPTASGKSAIAMRVARDRDRTVEIVAVDAFTIYRGMDVGTAKPTLEERDQVRHHLVDVLDPWEDVTVAWFQVRARAAIDDVLARGGLPLLVGGSGLYFRAVVDDLRFPPTDPEVRSGLEAIWAERPRAAWTHLREVDPEAAARIEHGNLRRTVRALEVLELTGERFSSFRRAWDDHESRYPGLEVTYVEPPTARLRDRIDARAEAMVDDGLLAETAALAGTSGGLSATAAQAIGYAEALAVVAGEEPADGLAQRIAGRTWNYARRQRSWFRKDPRCEPLSADEALARLA